MRLYNCRVLNIVIYLVFSNDFVCLFFKTHQQLNCKENEKEWQFEYYIYCE